MPATSGLTPIRRGWRFGSFLATLAAVLLVLAIIVSLEVRSNLRRLDSSTSDNIQWTLSQIEVEMLDLTNALSLAMLEDDPDLDTIRLEFDIFYSRVQTLAGSPFYATISDFEPFQQALQSTQRFLDETVPLIDGTDAQLRAALPDLHQTAQAMRTVVRKLAVVGLGRFAHQSDLRRAEVSDTLVRFAGFAIMLLAALVALIFYMLAVLRKARTRGAALSQANKRMNTILTTSLDGVIVADPSGRIMEFSSVAQKIFGLSAEQARQKRISDLFQSDQPLQINQPQDDTKTPTSENPVIGRDSIIRKAIRSNGDVFPTEVSIQTASDGRQDLLIAFLRDISQRVADKQELVNARDRALASEKAKAEFLTVMSHEIRTPLNGLLGNLSLLEETPLTPAQSQFIRNMEISGNVLSRHVDRVLETARFEARSPELENTPTDISALVQNVIDGQLGAADKQNTSLEWHWVGPPQQWVEVDPAALEQVLLNLLGNAIKFTPGGQIIIETEAITTPDSNALTLDFRVIDTGLGIPEKDLDIVFQDFVTRDASFGRLTGGTGLGLGIAQRIVKSMGGEIGVESSEGIGSVFWFQIPATPTTPPDAGTVSKKQPRADRPLDVLLVEDNEINRDVTCEMLRREGHSVTCQPDGKSGVKSASEKAYDLILMDISMPEMDGFQATEIIRQGNGASRHAPVIAFSANVLADDREKIAQAGMSGLLSKPLTRHRLVTLLEQVSRGKIAPAPLSPPGAPIVDQVHLNATREALGDAHLETLFARFEAEIDKTLQTLGALPPDGASLPRTAELCHKAASSAAVFGATALHDQLMKIEGAAKSADRNRTARELAALPGMWTKTQTSLRAALGNM